MPEARRTLSLHGKILAVAAAFMMTALDVAPAAAQSADACATRFHDELGEISAHQQARVSAAIAEVLKADPKLAGTWMFVKREDRLKARLAMRLANGPLTRDDKVCGQVTADRGGRVRCLKWIDKADAPAQPAPPPDLPATRDPPMSKGELALVSTLSRVVRSRGEFEEYDKNGRFYFLVTRTLEEIGEYLRQPLRPGLCSGATEMMSFYDDGFSPIRKRVDEFKRLTERAHDWITREARRLEVEENQTAGKSENVTPPQQGTDTPDAILAKVAQRHLTTDEASRIKQTDGLFPRLELFEDALSTPVTPKDEVESGTPSPVTTTDSKPSPVSLLRAIEAYAYADLAYTKSRNLDAAFKAMIQNVQDAHTKSCTCGD